MSEIELEEAVKVDNVNAVIEYLSANPQPKLTKFSLIHESIAYSSFSVLDTLLNYDNFNFLLEPNPKDSAITFPIHTAIFRGNDKAFQMILSSTKCTNEVLHLQITDGPYDSYTPLHLAVSKGSKNIAKSLISHREVDVNFKTRDGVTPLHNIGEQGADSIDILELLLLRGAKIFSLTGRGHSPLTMAVCRESEKIVNILLESINSLPNDEIETLLNGRDEAGDTLLHHAAKIQCQKLFNYCYEMTKVNYSILYLLCLCPVDTKRKNADGDVGLDVIDISLADLLEMVNIIREKIRLHFPTLDSLIDATKNDFSNIGLDSYTVEQLYIKKEEFVKFLNEAIKKDEERGSCPVVNVSSKKPIRSRKWLKSQELQKAKGVKVIHSESDESDSDSYSDGSDYSDTDSSDGETIVIEKNNKSEEPKCPFGFGTAADGVCPVSSKKEIKPDEVKKPKRKATKQNRSDKSSHKEDTKTVAIVEEKKFCPYHAIRDELSSKRFWVYLTIYVGSMWLVRELSRRK